MTSLSENTNSAALSLNGIREGGEGMWLKRDVEVLRAYRGRNHGFFVAEIGCYDHVCSRRRYRDKHRGSPPERATIRLPEGINSA